MKKYNCRVYNEANKDGHIKLKKADQVVVAFKIKTGDQIVGILSKTTLRSIKVRDPLIYGLVETGKMAMQKPTKQHPLGRKMKEIKIAMRSYIPGAQRGDPANYLDIPKRHIIFYLPISPQILEFYLTEIGKIEKEGDPDGKKK